MEFVILWAIFGIVSLEFWSPSLYAWSWANIPAWIISAGFGPVVFWAGAIEFYSNKYIDRKERSNKVSLKNKLEDFKDVRAGAMTAQEFKDKYEPEQIVLEDSIDTLLSKLREDVSSCKEDLMNIMESNSGIAMKDLFAKSSFDANVKSIAFWGLVEEQGLLVLNNNLTVEMAEIDETIL